MFLDLIARELRDVGFEVLDFRAHGRWWECCTERTDKRFGRIFTQAGESALRRDLQMMEQADCCFVVLPAGESVAMEVAWFCARDKPVVVWGEPRGPLELMWGMVRYTWLGSFFIEPGASLFEAIGTLWQDARLYLAKDET